MNETESINYIHVIVLIFFTTVCLVFSSIVFTYCYICLCEEPRRPVNILSPLSSVSSVSMTSSIDSIRSIESRTSEDVSESSGYASGNSSRSNFSGYNEEEKNDESIV